MKGLMSKMRYMVLKLTITMHAYEYI